MDVDFHTPERVRAHQDLLRAWHADVASTNPIIGCYRIVSSSFSDFCHDLHRLIQPAVIESVTRRLQIELIAEATAAVKCCQICHGTGVRMGASRTGTEMPYTWPEACVCLATLMGVIETSQLLLKVESANGL